MAFGWKRRMDSKDGTEVEPTDVDGNDAADGNAAADAEAAPDAVSELEGRILTLEAERDEALANGQRAMADYQNLRRRTQSDIEAAARRARGEVLGEALTVLDYLDMALATECTTEEGKNLQIGVSMTRGQLAALLERFKVKEIPATTVFDASKHQAFATIETDEHPPGSIVETFRKGWMYGDQVLRYAQVRVAAAPQVAQEGSSPEDSSADSAEVDGVDDTSSERIGD